MSVVAMPVRGAYGIMGVMTTASSSSHAEDVVSPEPPPLALLLQRVATGDQGAFAELYDQVAARLLGLVRRILADPAQAEEVTQEAFLDVWRKAGRFDPERGTALSWLMTIAHRRAVDRVRATVASRQRDETYEGLGQRSSPDTPEETAMANLDARGVRQALLVLSPAQRQAVELAYFEGCTHSQISERLGIPLGTAKTRIRDGLLRLRSEMGGGRDA